jgi:hypothetical protein
VTLGECPADFFTGIAEQPEVQAAGSAPKALTAADFPLELPASVLEGACLYSYEFDNGVRGPDEVADGNIVTEYGGLLVPTTADVMAALEASGLNMDIQEDAAVGIPGVFSGIVLDSGTFVSLTPRSATVNDVPVEFESLLTVFG